ncbi:hypothetical protein MNR01_10305 [Lysobacter sp. S4-A87]|nr:hypothetical protein [Lysobacter sp. S4-A87]UNK48169.1 hypothetical protein MNR01_10305 [Lysobacter sp. S4-A87]
MSEPDTRAARFRTDLQADIRRERRLLYAEIAILAVLVGLALLRHGVWP